MGLFSKYHVVHDKQIHDAVKLSCMSMPNVSGAYYFTYQGKLVVVYEWNPDTNGPFSENVHFHDGIQVLADHVPIEYGSKIDIWDEKHKADVPQNILNKTGYVSLYYEHSNRY